jgi:hypothetical protein
MVKTAHIAPRRAPPHVNIQACVVTLYVDNSSVPTAACVDIYGGQRLGVGSTAIGRGASRVATYGAAERAPIASTPVPCRSPAWQSLSTAALTAHPWPGTHAN